MYRAIIVEDEFRLREALSIMLEMQAAEKVQIVGYAESRDEAIKMIDRLKPDLVFMDIMLKNGTGFDVLQQIAHRSFHLIFTTAYEEYAIRAFKYSAIDYLLKPVDPEELEIAISRIEQMNIRLIEKEQLRELDNNLQRFPDRLVLPTQEVMHVVKIEQIIRCETSGSYTTFHSDGRKSIMVSKSLKNYEDILLPPMFFRVHQSHLINTGYIVSFSKEGLVQMSDGSSIPIARAKKDSFFKLMRGEFE